VAVLSYDAAYIVRKTRRFGISWGWDRKDIQKRRIIPTILCRVCFIIS
jgi:hypothetical protein